MSEIIDTNDVLLNLYKNIQIIIKNCEDIDNIIIYYLNKIIHIVKSNKYKNKNLSISKILEKLYKDLKLIYIYYSDDYESEMFKLRYIYLRLKRIKNNEYIINNHINILNQIF